MSNNLNNNDTAFKILSAVIKKKILYIKFEQLNGNYKYNRSLLIYRTKKKSDETEFEFSDVFQKKGNKKTVYKVSIDLSRLELKPMFWDFVIESDYQNRRLRIEPKNKDIAFLYKFYSLFYENTLNFENGMFVYPYLTNERTVGLQYREHGAYDNVRFRLKERLVLMLYLLSYYHLKKKKIILIYEKFCLMAQDNGYYFFKYCMDNNIEEKLGAKIYYIIDKGSKERSKLRGYEEHLLDFMSIRHMLYLLGARLLVSTDTRYHSYAWRRKGSILSVLLRFKKTIFLQHGVTAFKKVDFLYSKGLGGGCNIFIATSDKEKRIIEDNFGYKPKEVAVTGFARWDVLKDCSIDKHEILVMPTWRNWLDEVSHEAFIKSEYYNRYKEFLSSDGLNNFLVKNDYYLNFYLHPILRKYLDEFYIDNDRVRFISFGEEPLNELMMRCKALITDYSSVAWDVYYQRKPVIFYQFDREEYLKLHGSYIDFEKELFGENAQSSNEIIVMLERYLKNGFKLSDIALEQWKECFKYKDNKNCERICNVIADYLAGGSLQKRGEIMNTINIERLNIKDNKYKIFLDYSNINYDSEFSVEVIWLDEIHLPAVAKIIKTQKKELVLEYKVNKYLNKSNKELTGMGVLLARFKKDKALDTRLKFIVKEKRADEVIEYKLSIDNQRKDDILCCDSLKFYERFDYYFIPGLNDENEFVLNIKNTKNMLISNEAECRDINSNKGSLSFDIENKELLEGGSINIAFLKNNGIGIWKPEGIKINNANIELDMSDFLSTIYKKGTVHWTGIIETFKDGKYEAYILKSSRLVEMLKREDKIYYNRENRVFESFSKIMFEEEEYIGFPIVSEDGSIKAITCKLENWGKYVLDAKIIYAKLKNSFFQVKIRIQKGRMQYSKLTLEFRAMKEDDKRIYTIDTKETKEDNKYIYYFGKIDVNEIELRPVFWDLKLWMNFENEEYEVNLKNHSLGFIVRYNHLFSENKYRLSDNMFIYPCIVRNRSIALQYREYGKYDGISFRAMQRAAMLLYALTFWYFEKNKIYLVYEKYSQMAQDNGYYFFKYCMENDMESKMNAKIYYIMDKGSPDRRILDKFNKRVLDFMSIKHLVYLMGAKLFISTDTRNHSYAFRKKADLLYIFIKRKKLVFLQHGVTAMKKVDFFYGKGKSGGCDMFVVTSDYERDIVLNKFNYDIDEIAVTGFARWDVLEDKSGNSREILLMPTWRNWLDEVDDELFKKSDYYINYMNFLTSKKLEETLERDNLILNFYLHPKFKDYIQNFKFNSERIRLIAFGTEPLNELMMTCKMLITDYSSVSWDVYYQNKPVIFYQFDIDYYMEAHGSYMDMDTELFGDKAFCVDDVIEYIHEYSENDFRLKDKYAKRRNYYYKYIDNNNSRRICEHIIDKGW